MSESNSLRIHEIFHSIQGESLLVGKPTVFVRTTACNLRCHWCDTKDAFKKGDLLEISAIIERVNAFKTPYVCLTGGEPLGQRGIYPLMDSLLAQGKIVSLETNGSFSVAEVPQAVIKVIDIKCPHSGAADSFDPANFLLVAPHDQFKFVVGNYEDFEWAASLAEKEDLYSKCTVLFSPVYGQVKPVDLARWMLDRQTPGTFQLQLHKEIWGPEAKGV